MKEYIVKADHLIDGYGMQAVGELIRCKDCKHKHIKDNVWTCPFGLPAGCDFYCGYGERKTE